MPEDYKEKLPELLTTLFQLEDSADLDFGIYRIMNKKRDEIEHFINEELFDIVDAEFGNFAAPGQTELTDEVDRMQTAPKNHTISDQHKNAIFSHIHQFLSRYYDDGDYISQRRYSQTEKYAIPYNGEEVMLYWANNDQYYIKTGEHFKNYAFREGEYTINFCILDAESTMNNNKSDKRYFVLKPEKNPDYDPRSKTLTIFFEYRGLSKDEEKKYGTRNVQDNINEKTVEAVLSGMQNPGLKAALNGGTDDKAALGKHLRKYTKRNTSDYFIHKNLKGFLTRELEFYIKNEVFHLDDLGTGDEVSIERYVARAKVIKAVCLKIIDFLAQIEDFQKGLFEKKKFVMRGDYCMTLDNVPEKLYPDILRNDEQLIEWKALYGTNGSVGEAYLKKHPHLVLDTKFFDLEFKDELLASFDDLDDAVGGLMIKSENWQALNLMQEKYREKVKCIYIDPPYNTGDSEILYKNSYISSSWLSLIENRLSVATEMLTYNSTIFIAIDDFEMVDLCELIDTHFPVLRREMIVVNHHPQGGKATTLANTHEYMLALVAMDSDLTLTGRISKEGVEYRPFKRSGTAESNYRYGRPNSFYAILVNPKTKAMIGIEHPPRLGAAYPLENTQEGHLRIYPHGREGEERVWRRAYESCLDLLEKEKLHCSDNGTIYQLIEANERNSALFSNWIDKRYNAGTFGANLLRDIMGQQNPFSYPKSVYTVGDAIFSTGAGDDYICLDYFAGSGTTAHAVLNLNKEDGGNRKYIMVEMADYFDTVMKPRIQKVVYSDKWKDGKPQSNDGISHIFKYIVLEQYEDTLNNIEFNGGRDVQSTLLGLDGYFLRYMLDFETRDSTCRLNVEKMSKPFSYTLKITEGNEMKEETADLVETFNYLLGIHVRQIKAFNNNGTYYKVVFGTKGEDDIAIIWRNTEKIDLKADKAFIEETILNGSGSSKTYINADFFVAGACPIEPEFKKLMGV